MNYVARSTLQNFEVWETNTGIYLFVFIPINSAFYTFKIFSY